MVERGKKCCTLYKTLGKLCEPQINAMENESTMNLWHKCLRHFSEKGMQLLTKKELISDIKGMPLSHCVHCILGKQHRVSFSHSFRKKLDLMELVHSDVCGPMKVKSMGGASYFVTYIDDTSKKSVDLCYKT